MPNLFENDEASSFIRSRVDF